MSQNVFANWCFCQHAQCNDVYENKKKCYNGNYTVNSPTKQKAQFSNYSEKQCLEFCRKKNTRENILLESCLSISGESCLTPIQNDNSSSNGSGGANSDSSWNVDDSNQLNSDSQQYLQNQDDTGNNGYGNHHSNSTNQNRW
jgi:hypothetical protein